MNISINKKTGFYIQLVCWGLYYLIIMGRLNDNNQNVLSVVFQTTLIVSVYSGISYLNALVLIPKLFSNKKYIYYFLILSLIIILIPFITLYVTHFIESSFISLKSEYVTHVRPVRLRYLRILFGTLLFVFISTIVRLIIDHTRKEKLDLLIEKERLLTETKYLRAQMNPHFFLNALNTLQSIIRLSHQESEKYINTLAEMMRYVTYDCVNNKVSLEKEIKYIKNYIYFQEIKDDQIKVDFNTEIDNYDTLIEPMLFMPFIENAFKYYSATETTQPIGITINQYSNGDLYFKCENRINPDFKSTSDPGYSGLGIKNVRERLNAGYMDRYNLKVDQTDETFIIELYLKQITDN